MTLDVENKPMVHGPYNFLMQREPECPFCRQILLPVATIFAYGTAFCQKCHDALGPEYIAQVIATQQSDITRGLWTTTRGLRFFTPHGYVPKLYAAHLLPAILASQTRESPQPEYDKPPDLKRTSVGDHDPPLDTVEG